MGSNRALRDSLLFSWAGVAFFIFLVIAAFFLFTEHAAHTFGVLPWLLLLLCPLMHLFMHGGHGRTTADDRDTIKHTEHRGHTS